MFKQFLTRAIGVTAIATLFVFGSSSAAFASMAPGDPPTPNKGSAGTQVTLPGLPEPMSFTDVAAGPHLSLVIGSDGNTYANGVNARGQLGIGTTGSSSAVPTPVVLPAGVAFTKVFAGSLASYAFGDDGNTYAWGANEYGQLGDGTRADRNAPVQVVTPPGVTFTDLQPGNGVVIALGDDGNVYSWGQANPDLGNGGAPGRNTPGLVPAPDGVKFTKISYAGGSASAIAENGDTYVWGTGSLTGMPAATGLHSMSLLTPPDGITFTEVANGPWHAVAIGSDGGLYSWGTNNYGQLGDGTDTNSQTPVRVSTPPGVSFTQVYASGNLSITVNAYSLAIGDDGNAYGWGNNTDGVVLADGTTGGSVVTPTVLGAPAGVTYTKLAGGVRHVVAMGDDGNGYAWGFAAQGRLLDWTNPTSVKPTPQVMKSQAVMSIKFGDKDGTGITSTPDGDLSVTAPGGILAGTTVDITVNWRVFQEVMTPVTYPQSFHFPPVRGTYTDPLDAIVGVGEQATFTVRTEGEWVPFNPINLNWQTSANNGATWRPVSNAYAAGTFTAGPPVGSIAAGFSRTLTLQGLADRDGHLIRARLVEQASGEEFFTEPALLTVSSEPSGPVLVAPNFGNGESGQPLDVTVASGESATFKASIYGQPGPTARWEVSRDGGVTWQAVSASDPGVTMSLKVPNPRTLTIATSDADNGNQYRLVGTNSQGSINSWPVTLTVTPAPDPVDNANASASASASAAASAQADGDVNPAAQAAAVVAGLADATSQASAATDVSAQAAAESAATATASASASSDISSDVSAAAQAAAVASADSTPASAANAQATAAASDDSDAQAAAQSSATATASGGASSDASGEPVGPVDNANASASAAASAQADGDVNPAAQAAAVVAGLADATTQASAAADVSAQAAAQSAATATASAGASTDASTDAGAAAQAAAVGSSDSTAAASANAQASAAASVNAQAAAQSAATSSASADASSDAGADPVVENANASATAAASAQASGDHTPAAQAAAVAAGLADATTQASAAADVSAQAAAQSAATATASAGASTDASTDAGAAASGAAVGSSDSTAAASANAQASAAASVNAQAAAQSAATAQVSADASSDAGADPVVENANASAHADSTGSNDADSPSTADANGTAETGIANTGGASLLPLGIGSGVLLLLGAVLLLTTRRKKEVIDS